VGRALDSALADSLEIQRISLSLPKRIGQSEFQFIELSVRDLTEPIPSNLRMVRPTTPYYADERNVLSRYGAINLLFLDLDGSNPHLLLEKRAFIEAADIPDDRDSLQHFNLYRMVFNDTDGDQRLTRLDRSDLYCSDINGRNLRRITVDSLRVTDYTKSLQEEKVYISAKVRPKNGERPEEDWSEHLFVYDVRANLLSSFFADDEILKEARMLLRSN